MIQYYSCIVSHKSKQVVKNMIMKTFLISLFKKKEFKKIFFAIVILQTIIFYNRS